jgi:hypothetical protein
MNLSLWWSFPNGPQNGCHTRKLCWVTGREGPRPPPGPLIVLPRGLIGRLTVWLRPEFETVVHDRRCHTEWWISAGGDANAHGGSRLRLEFIRDDVDEVKKIREEGVVVDLTAGDRRSGWTVRGPEGLDPVRDPLDPYPHPPQACGADWLVNTLIISGC